MAASMTPLTALTPGPGGVPQRLGLERLLDVAVGLDTSHRVALRDGDAEVRIRAADAMGGMGAEAKAAVPALSDALQDGERVQVGKGEWLPVSVAAYAALRRIDPEAASKADEGRFWAFGL
jgi:hypothetical protein